MRRRLIAGNWKMNGIAGQPRRARRHCRRGRSCAGCRRRDLPAVHADRARGGAPAGARDRRAGLPCRRQGRAHRLHRGGHAGRGGRDDGDRRPQRTPRRSARDRRRGEGQGGGRDRRRAGRDRLLRRDQGPSSGRRDRRRSSRRSCAARCRSRGATRWSSPTSRSGRSGRGSRRPWPTSPRSTRRSAACWSICSAPSAPTGCASSMAARSTPANAAELLAVPDVDGALVGGASLTAAAFVPIIEAAANPVTSLAVRPERSRRTGCGRSV